MPDTIPNPTPDPFLDHIRRSLNHSLPLSPPPPPPAIPDPIARLVSKSANLIDLFIKSADDAHFHLTRTTHSDLPTHLSNFLHAHHCKTIGLPTSPTLDRLSIQNSLSDAGFTVIPWPTSTLDAAYDLDCGLTDVFAAIAETASLVILPTPTHGRALSLVPPIHIAIVEPANILPDLIDLFEKLSTISPHPPNITLITGPSKTADIEGALVTGVHGPGLVQVFLVE